MIRRLICKWLHEKHIAFAGIGSTYRCRRCMCEFPVPWAEAVAAVGRESQVMEKP